jgi:hypothetical protein
MAPAANPAQTYTIKVSGETRAVTLDEMQKMAEKAGGADKTFQEAAQARQLADLVARCRSGQATGEEWAYMTQALGLDAPPSSSQDQPQGQGKQGRQRQQDNGGGTEGFYEQGPITMDRLDPSIQQKLQRLEELEQQAVEQRRGQIQQNIAGTLDKDPAIGKMVSRSPELRSALADMTFKEMQRRALLGQAYGPEMLSAAVQSVRAVAETFGKLGGGSRGEPGLPGLGPATSVPPAFQAVEPPKERVPMGQPGREAYLLQKALAMQAEIAEGSGMETGYE